MKTLSQIEAEYDQLAEQQKEIEDRLLVLDVLADAAWEEENTDWVGQSFDKVV